MKTLYKSESFKLIGLKLSRKTTNAEAQSSKDCGELWQRFEREGVAAMIPNKLENAVYAVYYDYTPDGNFAYFIGSKVAHNEPTPEGLEELVIPEQSYYFITAKGKMTGCITKAWETIWQSDYPRAFTYDFEVYDQRSWDWEDAEVDIYISLDPNAPL